MRLSTQVHLDLTITILYLYQQIYKVINWLNKSHIYATGLFDAQLYVITVTQKPVNRYR